MTDFSLTTSTPPEAPTVREIVVSGDMTIHHAVVIRFALMEALAEAEEVRMDMSRVEEIDLTGLQLLGSAHRTSLAMKKRFNLGGCNSSTLKKALTDAGFKRHIGCSRDVDHTCIWTEVENNG